MGDYYEKYRWNMILHSYCSTVHENAISFQEQIIVWELNLVWFRAKIIQMWWAKLNEAPRFSAYYRLNRLIAYVFVVTVQVELIVASEHWLRNTYTGMSKQKAGIKEHKTKRHRCKTKKTAKQST